MTSHLSSPSKPAPALSAQETTTLTPGSPSEAIALPKILDLLPTETRAWIGQWWEQFVPQNGLKNGGWAKLRGGALVILGYLLSPLCWWNDLIFNLPIASVVGYLCQWVVPHSFVPGMIAGYWLSNVAGILLVQFGARDLLAKPAIHPESPDSATQPTTPRPSWQKEVVSGLVSSTIYTLAIAALVQFKVLSLPEGLSF